MSEIVLSDSRLEIIASHYKDSYDVLQEEIGRRDRFFYLVLVILFVDLFQLFNPEEGVAFFLNLVSVKSGVPLKISFEFVRTILWFLLFAITTKYFQSVISIERNYNYINELEKSLSRHFGGNIFTREGLSYERNYSDYCELTHILYTMLFPVTIFVVSLFKLISDFQRLEITSILFWSNLLFFVFITASISLYLYNRHNKEKSK